MLNRQRVLLYMLKKAGGTLTRIELMKWCFLLSQETSSRGGAAFYAFVPYKYGPYSFLLQQELCGLAKKGLLEESGSNRWSLSIHDMVVDAPKEYLDVVRIALRYKEMTVNELMDSVYSRYPWYTINSENLSRRAHVLPEAHRAVYTAGYQGHSIDSFLNRLLKCGIAALADVRNNPSSRNFGFHKSTLSRLCNNLGIEYKGFPELGIPSCDRMDLESSRAYEKMFNDYRCRILTNRTQSLNLLAKYVCQKPTALICVESDPIVCHRSVLSTVISERTSLPVTHLGASNGWSIRRI